MSSINSDQRSTPVSPDDPLRNVPRSLRSGADGLPNAVRTRSDHSSSTSSRSRFDEMLEEAFAQSSRQPLEFQFARERRSPRVLRAIAGAIAATIGVTVVAALVFFDVFPKLKSGSSLAVSISTPASAKPPQTTSEDPQALLQGFVRFQQKQQNDNPARNEALVEKFIQWQQTTRNAPPH